MTSDKVPKIFDSETCLPSPHLHTPWLSAGLITPGVSATASRGRDGQNGVPLRQARYVAALPTFYLHLTIVFMHGVVGTRRFPSDGFCSNSRIQSLSQCLLYAYPERGFTLARFLSTVIHLGRFQAENASLYEGTFFESSAGSIRKINPVTAAPVSHSQRCGGNIPWKISGCDVLGAKYTS